MKKLLAALCFALLACHASAAPASETSVETLLTLMKVQATLDIMQSGMEQAMRQGMQEELKGKSINPKQQAIIDDIPRQFSAVMRGELSWEKIKPEFIQIYREGFSQEEVDGLLVFYRSPVGQAYLTKMPQVLQRSMAVGQMKTKTIVPRLQAIMEKGLAKVEQAK